MDALSNNTKETWNMLEAMLRLDTFNPRGFTTQQLAYDTRVLLEIAQ